jgi:hypothetical protein
VTQQSFRLCDPAVDQQPEKRRLSKQCAAILARLKEGPATNRELVAISLNHTGRISDLRRSSYVIEVESHDHTTGLVVYRLVEKPKAFQYPD